MVTKKRSLGTGLDSLFGADSVTVEKETTATLPLTKLEPRQEQPRNYFDEEAIEELAESIRTYGIIQPIVVRKMENGYYQIVAGERRWRAARKAELEEVPVHIIEVDDRQTAELALVENLQREDLNPIEEAEGYRALMEDYAMTQEEVSSRIGKSRPAITNSLRLLSLHEEVRSLLEKGKLTAGHGRAIAGLSDPELQKQAAERVVYQGLSVRSTDKLVASLPRAPRRQKVDTGEIDYAAEESQNLTRALSRKCKIVQGRKAGRIVLEYYNDDDRELLLKNLYDMGKNWN